MCFYALCCVGVFCDTLLRMATAQPYRQRIFCCVLLIFVVLIYVFFFGLNGDKKREEVVGNGSDGAVAVVSDASPLVCDGDCWVISDSPGFDARDPEILNNGSIKAETLLYATKQGYQVIVYKRNIRNGSETEVFRYVEDGEEDISRGNYWGVQSPSVALSPNKASLVFSDEGGLKTYDVHTGETRVLIKKIHDFREYRDDLPKLEISGSVWSDDRVYAHSMVKPFWSVDAKYIRFLQSHYEGASIGLYDTTLDRYLPLPLGTLRERMSFVWGRNGNSFAWSWGDSSGLLLYAPSVPAFTDAVAAFGHPLDLGVSYDFGFRDPNISYDGSKVAFIATVGAQDYPADVDYYWVGFVTVDEDKFFVVNDKNFSIVDKSTDMLTSPFFSKDGNFLFYGKRVYDTPHSFHQHLFKYTFDDKETSAVALLPVGFEYRQAEWLEGDTPLLLLVGRYTTGGAVDSMGLFVLDLEKRNIVYASPVYHFQTFSFLGFIE